jgi:hypothetical protein
MMILRKTSLREHSGWNQCGEGAWTSSREGAAPGGQGGLPATDARIHGAWPTAGEDADGEGHERRCRAVGRLVSGRVWALAENLCQPRRQLAGKHGHTRRQSSALEFF